MRFFEFTYNKVTNEEVGSNPADDLAYLISNTELSPEVLKYIQDTLNTIVDTEEDGEIEQRSYSNTEIQSPGSSIAPDKEDPTDKLKESSTASMEAELKAALDLAKKQGTHDKKLSQLLYIVRDDAFKKLASEIVKNKFKSKNQESYELIKNKIRGLSTKIPVYLMTDFLNDCKEGGVIDAPQMIRNEGKSSNIPVSDPKYINVVKAFLDIELPRIGRGEIGLAFAGIDTVKGATDITVSGIDIEVKASRGVDFFMKGNADEGGFGNQNKAVEILAKKLATVGSKFKANNRSKQGGIASVGKTNITTFNLFFQRLGHDETVNLLVDVLKELNKKKPDIVEQYRQDIEDAVAEDGSVNYSRLGLATAKINFDYYKAMANHAGVLVLNLKDFQYHYISKSETWAKYIKNNILVQQYALDFRTNGLGGIAYTVNAV